MSETNLSQDNESAKESDDEYSDEYDDEDMNDYYNNNEDFVDSDVGDDVGENDDIGLSASNNLIKKRMQELEHFEYDCLDKEETTNRLNKDTEMAASILNISESLARLVLQANKWKLATIKTRAAIPAGKVKMLTESGVLPALQAKIHKSPDRKTISPKSKIVCGVCFEAFRPPNLASVACKHMFCQSCWKSHIEFTVTEGMNAGIPCMESECNMICPEDFVKQFLSNEHKHGGESVMETYKKHLFRVYVTSHYKLRFCPGVDCPAMFYAETPKPRRVTCKSCKTTCCFECGNPYHIPTDCETIRKWLTKCADDSETANYISVNTKDCPACHICIEKNGGCNHIQCTKCKFSFCWMCLGDWKSHGNSYYECSRYKENPMIANTNKQTIAREALKKYLFYFERWENHSKSLQLEKQAREKIQAQIREKVNKNEGTWIDWQYLLRAGELLAKCRYTLHYTYPLAYYAETGPEKTLFEYQQAQLEVEIEGLAWKLEHVGDFQRGEVENQMDVCEKRTQTLLARFVQN